MSADNYFCKNCIGDDYFIHWLIKKYGEDEECDECHADTKVANIEELIKNIEPQLTAQIQISNNDFYHPRHGLPYGDPLDAILQEMGLMPTDTDVEYRATQMVANYIQHILLMDGIAWTSAQFSGGTNVALFYEASPVFLARRISGELEETVTDIRL